MYPFIKKYLVDEEQGKTAANLIREALNLPPNNDIEEIEEKDIAHFIRTYWYDFFQEKFEIIERYGKTRYYDARTVTSLIVEGRNRVSHQRLNELDGEFTRAQLFFIVEILGRINRLDAQHEVETIRDKLLDDAAEQIKKIAVKVEKAKYQKSITEVEKSLASAEESKKKLSKQVLDNAIKLDEEKRKAAATSRLLKAAESKNAQYEENNYKDQFETTSKELEAAELERDDYKERLEGKSEELKDMKAAWGTSEKRLETVSQELKELKTKQNVSEERLAARTNQLAAMQYLFTTATLEKPEIRSIFPALEIDSAVRILDRRGTDKRNYLSKLLEQKQPTLIYVQSEEKVERLLKLVGPEKEGVMGKHTENTSDAEEKEILEKLESGGLTAIVSSRTVATLLASHCVEHFVFCHLTPDLDAFFEHCRPAFSSTKDVYLHLIYNSKEDTDGLNEWLTRKYPTDEVLRNLYKELKDLVGIDGDFFDPKDIYSKLNAEKLGTETGFDIFEELHLLERNKGGIKLLPPSGKKLDESKIYDRGEKLKHGIAEVCAFQLELSLEEIWEEILKKINVNTAQILRESSIDKINTNVSEVEKGVRPATKAGQSEITLPTVDVWPQRGMSAFNNLRHQITKASNETDILVEEFAEDLSSLDDVDSVRVRDAGGVYNSPVLVNQGNYRNKYELAIQFIQEYGIDALEEGIAQLIKDRDDPDYNFTEDETNMLRAFQDAFWNFRTQSQ